MGLFLVLVILVTLVGAFIVVNNRIVARKNQVAQAFGSIDVYLKKRFDLLPNLVIIVNEYIAYEKELIKKVTELRSNAGQRISSEEKINLSNEFTRVMSSLTLATENYPSLKANTHFINLNAELSDLEDQLSAARRGYNAAVTNFNTTIKTFPGNLFARLRNDKTLFLLEIPDVQKTEVNLNQITNN